MKRRFRIIYTTKQDTLRKSGYIEIENLWFGEFRLIMIMIGHDRTILSHNVLVDRIANGGAIAICFRPTAAGRGSHASPTFEKK